MHAVGQVPPTMSSPMSLGTNHLKGNAELQMLGIEYGDDIFDSVVLDLDKGVSNPSTDKFENYYSAPGSEIASLDAVQFDASVLKDADQPFEEDSSEPEEYILKDEIAAKKKEMEKEDLKEGNAIIKKAKANDFLDDWFMHKGLRDLEALEHEASVFNNKFLSAQEAAEWNGTIYSFDPSISDEIDKKDDDYHVDSLFTYDPGFQDIARGVITPNKPELKLVKKDD